MNNTGKHRGSFLDDWELHKHDLVWRKFWALWELKRKWNWTNWYYLRIDKDENEIVAPEHWSLNGGVNYMQLCIWISFLRSLHEGLTDNLDSYDTPKQDRIHPSLVFDNLPKNITSFPAIKGSPFRDFRNGVFHCQWSPTFSKFKLDQKTVNKLEILHLNIGKWVNTEFRKCFIEFKKHYTTPTLWIYTKAGEEFMPETFF